MPRSKDPIKKKKRRARTTTRGGVAQRTHVNIRIGSLQPHTSGQSARPPNSVLQPATVVHSQDASRWTPLVKKEVGLQPVGFQTSSKAPITLQDNPSLIDKKVKLPRQGSSHKATRDVNSDGVPLNRFGQPDRRTRAGRLVAHLVVPEMTDVQEAEALKGGGKYDDTDEDDYFDAEF